MPKDRFEISRLLSGRHRLTVEEKEAVLERVLAATAAAPPAESVLGLSRFGLRAALATVLSLLVMVPLGFLLFRNSPSPSPTGEFSSRGGGDTALLQVICLGGDRGVCRDGDKLTFRLRPPVDKPYFGAFARHLDDDLVIWYFPLTHKETTSALTDKTTQGVLSDGIRIGSEHPSGKYEVYGIFSKSPMNRDEIRRQFGDHFEVKAESASISSVSFSVER